jgi:hypothetical protein
MNATHLFKIFILLCIAFVLHSCKKLIEIDPPTNVIGTEEVFKTNEQANSAMAGIYSQMMTNVGAMIFSNGGLTVYGGLSSDEFVNFSGTNVPVDYQFLTNKLDMNNSVPGSLIWQPAYKVIYGANAIVEGIAASTSLQLNDSARKVLTGEALFIRAFCYFYLTNFFGDVPLVLTTDISKMSSMSRTAQATVYNQIVRDLQEAQKLLTVDYAVAGGERVRPNKWAATALLARTQLYLKNWEDAEREASAVIDRSTYSLPSNLKTVFLKNSTESIWQLKQNPIRLPYNGTWDGYYCLPMIRWPDIGPDDQFLFMIPEFFTEYAAYLVPAYYFSPQQSLAFEANDKRKSNWVDSTPSPDAPPYNQVPYYYANKYTLQMGTMGAEISQYNTVLRLGEQYLIRAEARAQLNDYTGAAADIDKLRSRAGLLNTTAASKEDLIKAVAHERQTELFAEWGHRWLDLKRTGQANAVLGAIPAKQPWKSFQLLYPIPTNEIISNPNIKQNPQY